MTFYIRVYNNLNCLMETRRVRVDDGGDADGALQSALLNLITESLLAIGDTIKIEEA